MRFRLSQRSRDRLDGVHPDLVAVVELAIQRSPIDFVVLEGLRDIERQKELVAKGASKTMNSRHLTGHAVDIAPLVGGEVSWHWPHYYMLEPVIKQAAADLGVPIEWGGDWKSFKDGPHWQLPWAQYPKGDLTPRSRPITPPLPDVVPITPEEARRREIAAQRPGGPSLWSLIVRMVAAIINALKGDK